MPHAKLDPPLPTLVIRILTHTSIFAPRNCTPLILTPHPQSLPHVPTRALAAVYFVGPLSGGHLNPLVSLAGAATGHIDLVRGLCYAVAQVSECVVASRWWWVGGWGSSF